MRALLYAAGRTRQFPDKVKAEARAVAEPGPSDFKKRLDLRAEPIFTIDSAETKDIDDAISVTACADGWQLGVHIADVSHYVRAGSAMDKEAMQRGTSVYFADNVVPMLPRQLSNGVCSLNEGADRLAFSCIMPVSYTHLAEQQQTLNSTQGLLSAMMGSQQTTQDILPTGEGIYHITYRLPYPGMFVNYVQDYIDQYNEANPDSPMVYDYIAARAEVPWFDILLMVMLVGSMVFVF